MQLLEERRLSFAFCIGKGHMLMLAGFGLLCQTIDLDQKGKLIQDSQRLLCTVISTLERMSIPGSPEFKRIACAIISVDGFPRMARFRNESASRRRAHGVRAAPDSNSFEHATRRLSAVASDGPRIKQEPGTYRPFTATGNQWVDMGLTDVRNSSQQSFSSGFSDPASRSTFSDLTCSTVGTGHSQRLDPPNLDYFDFSNAPASGSDTASPGLMGNPSDLDFKDTLALATAAPQPAFVEGVFPAPDVFSPHISTPSPASLDWASDMWNVSGDLYSPRKTGGGITHGEEFGTSQLAGDFSGINMN